MSMRPNPSPLTVLKLSRPDSVRRRVHFAGLLALLGIAAGLSSSMPSRAQKLPANIVSVDRALGGNAPAYQALMEGRVDDATSLLHSTLAANPTDATAHQLLCRVFYAQNEADGAIHQCELAAAAAANNSQASDDQVWLGRAYGMKARHAGPIAGFTLARKVQACFARAVELNPANLAALNDLGEYYVAAPGIVGGGDDKAQALAARMMPHFPAAAHRLLARMADSSNDLATAEAEFKRAVGVQGAPEAWIDLAQFYRDHSRPDDALAAIKSGLAADRTHGPVLVDAASILTASKRAPDLAERCLRTYLASTAKSDEAPAFKVHIQLSKLLAAYGDSRDATREAEAAAALAPAFKPNASPGQGL
jgi:tetratricopeptide (TPR) repeat protein